MQSADGARAAQRAKPERRQARERKHQPWVWKSGTRAGPILERERGNALIIAVTLAREELEDVLSLGPLSFV
ncbi:MAG TPA: hypothetical protein VFV38_44565 [Ktedonobacteraceae bacterium]|nr:hypothetical protein [Ktedonobacteraceae bacterium]